jgi:hypothetical protein
MVIQAPSPTTIGALSYSKLGERTSWLPVQSTAS